MKTSSFYWVRILLICFSFGIAGFVNAKQNQRPYHLQREAMRKNKYYYYPRQNVYFDPVHRVYFVWEKTYWRPLTQLPPRYVSVTYSSSPRFELWIASEHPYYYNPEHRRTYYEYRVSKPAPVARARVESRPKPNVSFSLEINPVVVEPQPVYVEEHVIVHHPHHPVYHYPPGHGHGHRRGHENDHGHGRHH